ncbi:hypothetical protein GC163_02655 [bacterium]|nr:hypothetical protein [bacterium]
MKTCCELLLILCVARSLPAQTVQQPVVQSFGGATTVSVPDRGSIVLGGVSSAASGRQVYGPGYRGSSYGIERSASSISVGVTIIDLHEMDEALLSQGSTAHDDNVWFDRLQTRAAASQPGKSRQFSTVIDRRAEAERFERLATAAEAKGKHSLAKLHWQMAAKYGSVITPRALEPQAVPRVTLARPDR